MTDRPETTRVDALRELVAQIERHCPCGARPESLNTHPHVAGCPVEKLVRLVPEIAQHISADPVELREKAKEIHAYLNGEACGYHDGGTKCLDCEGIAKILAQHISAAEQAAYERAAQMAESMIGARRREIADAIRALSGGTSALELERLEAQLDEANWWVEHSTEWKHTNDNPKLCSVCARREDLRARIAALKGGG